MGKDLDTDQLKWVNGLTGAVKKQKKLDARDEKKRALLDKFAEEREKKLAEILKGMQIKVGRLNDKGKLETMEVSREDLDQMKSFDIDDENLGWKPLGEDGKTLQDWASSDQTDKMNEAVEKIERLTKELFEAIDEDDDGEEEENEGGGKKKKKPLFSPEEIESEVMEPLVRRGVPETFVGNKYSKNDRLVKGSMQEYTKRLEKEKLKGFCAENKDLGIAMFRMVVALPGNIMSSDVATHLSVSQQETSGTPNPIQGFQQSFSLQANSNNWSDPGLQGLSQAWQFLQNVSDGSIDGVRETVNSTREKRKDSQERKKERAEKRRGGGEDDDDDDVEIDEGSPRAKQAPMAAQAVIAAVAMAVGSALEKLGTAGSTIFSTKVKKDAIAKLLAKKDVKADDVKKIVTALADGIAATLKELEPDTQTPPEFDNAKTKGGEALHALDAKADTIANQLLNGKLEEVVSAFNDAAKAAGTAMSKEVSAYAKKNEKDLRKKASEFVSKDLKESLQESVNSKADQDHKEEKGHEPDWIEYQGAQVCLRCEGDGKDVKAFAGLIDVKIKQLKKEEYYFKMAVNLGGMAFDVASNFLAPLAMGGALLRMSKFIFAAVKRWRDFHYFIKSHEAMMNGACACNGAVKLFRNQAFAQGMHYSINAACEGVKIVGACLQCSPAVIGGIIATNAASATEAIEAVLYEIGKRKQLSRAWSTYKQALHHPDNRRLGLVAARRNPTLAKYAIAWGAVIEKDPLVIDFVAYTGINADTLEGNAHIDKVVEYLEVRMPDDIAVVGRRYAAKVSLTLDCWIREKAHLESETKVQKQDTSGIESALAGYEEEFKKASDSTISPEEVIAALTEAIRHSKAAKSGITAYRHYDDKKVDIEEVLDVKNAFLSKLNIEEKALMKLLKMAQEEAKERQEQNAPKVVGATATH